MSLEIPLSEVPGEDLYPTDEDEQKKVVTWVQRIYTLSKDSKRAHLDRWGKFYRMYRSYVKKRTREDWKSRLWIPVAFYVIETITPRLVAQLPKFTVVPVSGEDAQGADELETLLDWATDRSGLEVELVKGLKSALMYGTGIFKTSYVEEMAYQISREPMMNETTAQVPMGELDINGKPMMQSVSVGAQPTGQTNVVRRPYVAYAGPKAEAVDITNFFIDPIADSIENARYVIHRVYRDKAYLEEKFKEGMYKKPPQDIWVSFLNENASLARLATIGLGSGATASGTDDGLIELLEVWTPTKMVTVAGGGSGGILLRAERNPFAHGEMPFSRIVDHLVPHEFWGIGELEPLEGLQDMMNELWNARIDNVKLVLNTMFMAVMDYIEDPADLQVGPGKIVRVREGIPLNQAVQRLELGQVTQNAYEETAEVERMTEKVSGVSQYTTGTGGGGALNRTATGVALISEQGNTRFAHKVRMAELTGFRRLARQFATIIQQYSPPEITVRLLNEAGEYVFRQISADAIGGRYDFDVEAESSAQTESIRREQTLSLFQLLAADPYMKPLKIRADVLKVFGRKDIQDYMVTPQELQMAQQQAAAAQGQPQGGPPQTQPASQPAAPPQQPQPGPPPQQGPPQGRPGGP